MSKAPAMPLFCGDYLKDTPDLTPEEHGCYLLLLMYTWSNGCKPIPDDDDRIARRLRITKERWLKRIRPVLAPMFDLSGGTWRSPRLEKEWAYVQEKIAAQRANGARGGRPKSGPNGPNSLAQNREDFSENPDANSLNGHDTPKATGFDRRSPTETPPSPSSAYAEERKEESVCDVGVNPREAHTQAAPDSPAVKSSNVVPIRPDRAPEVAPLPEDWLLPAEWRCWAEGVGWTGVNGSAERFAIHWLGKKDRGDRDAANSEAQWLRLWKGWINGDIKRGRGHGQQRHDTRQRSNGGLAAVILADIAAGIGNPQGGPDGW